MKKFLFIVLLCVGCALSAQEASDLNWMTDFDKAKKISKKEKKPILIYFTGSDWCSPCKMLKEDFFNTEEFKAKAEDLVLVEADFPRRVDIISKEQRIANNVLARKYNKKASYPAIIAVDHNGKVLDEIYSYSMLRDASRHFEFVKKLLANN